MDFRLRCSELGVTGLVNGKLKLLRFWELLELLLRLNPFFCVILRWSWCLVKEIQYLSAGEMGDGDGLG